MKSTTSLTRLESKNLKTLQTKKGRETLGQFLVSGVRLLEEAHHHRVHPLAVYVCENEMTDRGLSLAGRFSAQGVPVITVLTRDLESFADTTTPQGIAALFTTPATILSEQLLGNIRRILVCENISDPGNLGTLMRSALAFGFKGVVSCGSSAELWSPKVVRASAGAIFGLTVMQTDIKPLLQAFAGRRISLVAADLRGQDIGAVRFPDSRRGGVALAVGSEADGLTTPVLTSATHRVRIGQLSDVDSLNAAVAGSILMHRIFEVDNKV
jgi:RNA methyltransferase, TrmH family